MSIRVLIVERHALARKAMIIALKKHPDIDVVAAVDGDLEAEELVELAEKRRPDVAIFDFSTKVPGVGSFSVVEALRSRQSKLRLLALVRRADGILIRRLRLLKVTGCLFSDDGCSLALGTAVRNVYDGRLTYSQGIYELAFQHLDERLTKRELDVLSLLGEGLSNKGIAKCLSISTFTVQNHISSIYGKLGIPQGASKNRRVCAINAARRSDLAQTVTVGRAREPHEDWPFG